MTHSSKSLLIAILMSSRGFAAEQSLEFVDLFNGNDLSGWVGQGYKVIDGVIVCTPEGRNLMTAKRYSQYILEFEFKLPPAGNNGLGIHYPGTGDAAYTGMELQILDDTAPEYQQLKDYQFHGSIYTMVAAQKGYLKPLGQWNQQRVTVTADDVTVELNGTVITKANLNDLQKKFPQHDGVKRRAGQIGWCGHGDRVAFRNIRIAETAAVADVETWKKEGFVPLFDGSTFTGWRLEKGSEGHWRAMNGMLCYDGKSEATNKDLWTSKEFKDVTLRLDWRWSGMGEKRMRPIIDATTGNDTGEKTEVEELDSGIYLRGNITSQVNLWNWSVGSGEVYGYRTNQKLPPAVRAGVTPKENADKPLGEWNRMEITLRGDLLTVISNGKKVIDTAQLPGVPPQGVIGFQHHGSSIDFANVWVMEW